MPNSQDYAIVVGISEYAAYDLLKSAIGDAQAFADWLRKSDGGDVPADQVKIIVKSSDMRGIYPIKDDVDNALADIISGRAGRVGRRFYFYFSGHGCSPSADELLLLLANASNEMLLRNIGAAPYRKFLQEAALFDELIFIFDCCRDYQNLSALAQPPSLTPLPRSPASVNVKLFVALGTEYGQSSFAPNDGAERSFFTKFLIEGLSSARNADGSVTAQSLQSYVKPRVTAEAQLHGKIQVPEISTNPDIVFRSGVPGQGLVGRLLSFTIPATWTRPIELQDGSFNVVRRVNGTDGKFQTVLAPGLYEIVYPADAGPAENVLRQRLRVNPASSGARVTLIPDPDRDQYNV